MKEWLKMLLCSICILTMLLHLLPDGKFEKYVRFYAGLLFLLIALEPLIGFLSKKEDLSELFSYYILKEDSGELLTSIERVSELKNTRIQESYQREVRRQITQLLDICTRAAPDIQITFAADGYTPSGIVIRLSDTTQTEVDAAAIRQELCSVYAFDADSIRIFDAGGEAL